MQSVHRSPRTNLRRDDGQAVTWLLVIGMLAMGMLAMKFALPLAEGGDRLGGGQTSAEAAALAGAEAGAPQLLADLTLANLASRLGQGCTSYGEDEAADLAARNGGRLTNYCYDVARGQVGVSVRSARQTSTGHRVATRSDASWALDWADCRLDPSPTTSSPSTSSQTPTPPTTSTVPTDRVMITLRCGTRTLELRSDPDTGRLRLDPADQLADVIRPRLVR